MKKAIAVGALFMVAVSASAHAQTPGAQQVGADALLSYPAVNDTVIRCAATPPRSAEQLAAQFETRPRDLDEMSAMARRFMDPKSDSPAAVAFRARQAEQRASDWAYLCRYRDANAALKQGGQRPRVVFMGDSITEGWIEANRDFFQTGYVDRGISGQSSTQMVARFYHDVVALRPRVVHIMAGTNDIGGATGAITEDEYVYNIKAMIDLAQANDIKVVLAALPPMSRLLPRPEFDVRPMVRTLNGRLRRLADEEGVIFVDYFTPLADPQGGFDPRYANDGVHPTRAGYAVMEPLAKAALDEALQP
ncbi:GDSL-type esterase/lipase family protein [Caulobacter sp. NIBR2454]|uniref:GDSL-type esterase/lipase family protein n=1 Tax=Caulobacter sp. NIBR2454 TaxID=3015996 RepID=UPI0022B750DB|nr:GDSL-type esterase/lipase family protein [Caulobacter sp. NIBR2454]